ncbi:MAG: class I SAM-dependent methyltransferase [Clostridia bacterium]|nr:class I SAM-dependent methyltransferase [Clostridia bacterium]
MDLSTAIIKFTNKLFPKQTHPLNLQNDGIKTYAEWQFEKGRDTIAHFLPRYSEQEMFEGKDVLDMGCGAAGKSLYYVKCGAKQVTGAEIVAHYEQEANALAQKLGYADRFRFICASAYAMPFEDASFDTIIMNDFMEHVDKPEQALLESLRLIRPGGRIYINFPPYYHPFGAHMSDAINMPWVHAFFGEQALIRAYKELVRDLPDGQERLDFRFSKDENGIDRYTYINKMTLKRFQKILQKYQIQPAYYAEVPLRGFLKPLAKCPLTKEFFVKMAVCSISK